MQGQICVALHRSSSIVGPVWTSEADKSKKRPEEMQNEAKSLLKEPNAEYTTRASF
jgi:hypothetical protein